MLVTPRPFISYAHEDAGMARRIYDDLRALGAEPWFDKRDLVGGQHWQDTIREAVRNCSHFIALLSSNSVNKRGFVQRELRQAIDILTEFPPGEIFVIPVRVDDVQPTHEEIRKLHWVDLFPSYQEGLRQLARSMGLPESIPRDGGSAHGSPLLFVAGVISAGAAIAVMTLWITKNSNDFIRNPFTTTASAPAVSTPRQPSAAVIADQELVAANFESVSKLRGDLYLQTHEYVQQITFSSPGAYDVGRDKLNPEAQQVLLMLISPIAEHRLRTLIGIEIYAHTDNAPTARSNWALSAARAARVAEFLESAGIEPSLLLPVAPAQHQPLLPPADDTRGRNRRLELRLHYADPRRS